MFAVKVWCSVVSYGEGVYSLFGTLVSLNDNPRTLITAQKIMIGWCIQVSQVV